MLTLTNRPSSDLDVKCYQNISFLFYFACFLNVNECYVNDFCKTLIFHILDWSRAAFRKALQDYVDRCSNGG